MYVLNTEKVFYDISEGESIVINFVTGNYYCFNKVGAAAFDFIEKGGDPQKISAGNMDELNAFIKVLTEKEILKKDDTPYLGIEFDNNGLEVWEAPVVTEYDEIRDLILADPVNEVQIWE